MQQITPYQFHQLLQSGEALEPHAVIEAQLNGFDLSKKTLNAFDFSNSVMTNLRAYGTKTNHSKWTKAIMTYARCPSMTAIDSDFTGINAMYSNLCNANLSFSNFSQANLGYARLHRSNLQHSIFDGAELSECDLTLADLTGATMTNVKTSSTLTVKGAKLRFVQMTDSTLILLDAETADLLHANLDDCYLHMAFFNHATLNYAKFQMASITESDFTEASVIQADFTLAHISDCDFSGADLSGANFHCATIQNITTNANTCFRNANFDCATVSDDDKIKIMNAGGIL
jgi:uncharacterized protein YjbI with pentapeptide repeats